MSRHGRTVGAHDKGTWAAGGVGVGGPIRSEMSETGRSQTAAEVKPRALDSIKTTDNTSFELKKQVQLNLK
jgi:hypothetical protein